jgi:hypothetical protein
MPAWMGGWVYTLYKACTVKKRKIEEKRVYVQVRLIMLDRIKERKGLAPLEKKER